MWCHFWGPRPRPTSSQGFLPRGPAVALPGGTCLLKEVWLCELSQGARLVPTFISSNSGSEDLRAEQLEEQTPRAFGLFPK